MNKIHQLVWSARLGYCVAVSEVASSAGARRGSGARRARRLAAAAAAALAALTMGQAMAQVAPAPTTLPTGGQVVQGQANLRGAGSTAAPVLNIDQASQRAVINWSTFNLGAAATVNFNQPNAQAATLNRVQDMNPSQIFGHINAPGQVTLINPAGVYFSPGAVLDVGALTATTMQQSDADFMAGGANFTRSGSTGSVVNAGSLQAALGGYIALLAPEVRNEGLIVAQQGTVALASGEAIRLNFDAQSRLTSMTVTPSQIAALVENKTAVQVGGGQILLSATAVSGLQGSVVNSGSLSASSLTAKGGRIVLEGDSVTLASGSSIDARGATGGGTVLVGGDWQGAAGTYQATTVAMAGDASIDASATQSGDGGKVVLWSDVGNASSSTTVNGSIAARGGVLGGNGGKVETSGHSVDSSGARIDAGADQGTGGLWLIDPADVTITQGIADTYRDSLNLGTSVLNDVTGSITWNSGVTLNKTGGGAATLTLRTTNNGSITLNSGASITSTSNPLNLVLWTRYNNEGGSGFIFLNGANINTNGGNVSLSGGDSTTWGTLFVGRDYANTYSLGGHGINLTGTTINTGGGNMQIKGQSYYTGGTAGNSYGVVIAGGSSLTTTTGTGTGTGTIDIVGDVRGMYTTGVGVLIGSSTAAGSVTIASDGGAINIIGTGTDQNGSGSGFRHAVSLKSDNNDQLVIKSTSGAITLNGAASFSALNFTNSDSSGLQLQANTTTSGIQVVSRTGAINLLGSNSLEATAQNVNGIRFTAADVANSIRIGYDGSNAYSGNILVQSNSIEQLNNNVGVGSLSVQSTGTLTVQSAGNAFTYLRAGSSGTLSFDNDWNFGTGLSAFTLGKSTNTLDLTLSNALTTAGPISLYGGNVALNANLTTTAAGGAILAKGSGNVTTGNNQVLQTNGGAITLWADSDANGGGYILLNESTKLDSRTAAARTTNAESTNATTATGGGDITLGGGNGATAAAGYASSAGTTNRGGVNFGDQTYNSNAHTNLTTIYSGGGNIVVRGKQTVGTMMGINWVNGGTLNAGAGTVTLDGTSAGGHGMEIGSWQLSGSANIYAGGGNAGTPAITLTGTNTTAGGNAVQTAVGSFVSNGAGGIGITGTASGSGSGSVVLGSNLTSTLSGAGILVKASGNITSNASRSFQTNNGDLIFWSNASNGGTAGALTFGDSNTFNTANGSTGQATGGGKIVMAGGLDDGSNGGTAGDGLPDGFASSSATNGITLGTAGTTSMYSGGGSILLRGNSTGSGLLGIQWNKVGTVDAGNGTVSLVGTATQGHGIELGASSGSTSITAGGGDATHAAISIVGTTTSTTSLGIQSNGGSLQAITATGGGITVTGTTSASSAQGINLGMDALAASGPIAITAIGGTGLRYSGTLGKKASTGVTASTSNVTLTANALTVNSAMSVDTTGTLTVQPYSTSFTSALSWPLANFTVANVTGLTLGKLGNLADITVTSDQSINGPISIYGGNVALNASLASTATATATATMVKVLASGDITLAANKTVTTQGGSVLFNSDADGNGAGAIVLGSGSGITSNNGNITLGGGSAGTGAGNAVGDSAHTAGIAIGGTLNVGAGALVARGQGYAGANYNYGIALNTATVTASGAGTIDLTGTGGAGTGTNNIGINGNGTLTGGATGALTLTGTGTGGAATGGFNYGLNLTNGTVIGSGGGNVNLTGTGGGTSGSSGSNDGIYMTGASVNSGVNAGVGGVVNVTGTSGLTSGGYNNGVQLVSSTTINSAGGTNVTGFGRGSGTSANNYGVDVEGGSVITGTGSAPVVVAGSSAGGSGGGNFGVIVQGSSSIGSGFGSGGGTINVTGTGNSVSGGLGVSLSGTAAIASGGNAAVTVTTDSITVGGNGISAGSGTVTVQNLTAGTLVKLGGADVLTGSTLTLGLTSAELNLITAGTLVVGRNDSAATGVMTVSNTVSRPASTNLTLKTNSDLTLDTDAALTLGTNSTLTLTAAGSVSQSITSNITATNLLLNGAGGSYALATATGNDVGTLAAIGTGTLSYKDSNGLTIGTIGVVNGINVGGAVSIGSGGLTSGDLTVAQSVRSADTSGSAIVLNAGVAAAPVTIAGMAATGGNLVLSGSPVISTGTGGRATLMTGALSNAALTALVVPASGHFRYHSDEAVSNFSPTLSGDGVYAIYREQPTVALTGATVSMVYGAAVPAPLVTATGAVNGDVITPTGTVGGTTSPSGNYTVAGPHTITPSTAAITALGYAVSTTDGALTVTAKGLTVSGSTAANKVYDQTTTATVSGGTLVGVISGDTVTLTQAGNFATANVGNGIAVTTGDTIGGAQVGNYSLTQPTGLSANITPKGLTVSGSTAANKVYDQTTTATVSGGTLVGVISGDTVTLTQAGNFATANVGNGIAVTTGDTIGGAQVGNYSLTQPTGLSANITPKGLTVSGSTAANKVYDQTTTATITGGTLVGVISGDTVTLTQAGNFATANVGNGIAVTTGDTIGGAQVGNYSLTQPTGLSANITAKELTVSGSTAANKVYDKTTTATVSGGTLVGVISGDTVTLTQAGNFATANVGNGIAVTTGDTIGGAQVGNYSLTQPTGLSANITAKELTVSGSTAANKVYDQTTTATVSGGTLVGVISGDTVTLTQAGNFATANVGTAIAVTTGDTIGGAQVGNYSLTQPTGLSANITAKELTVSGSTAANKVYDKTTTATVSGGTLVGVISGDTVTLTQAGNFATANVGAGIAVTTGDTIGGAQVGNYSLTQPTGLSANITAKELTVSGSTAANKVYDKTTTATVSGGTLVGVISGDTVTLTQAGNFATANVGNGIAVTTGDTIGGAQVGNYSLTQPTGLSANITAKELTVSGSTAANKVYDQTTTATVSGGTLVGVISGDTVTLTQAGNFATANVGTAIAVTTGDTIGGAQVGNYSLTQPTGLSANITAKELTVSGSTAANKVYDKTTTATVSGGTLVGVISGDTVTLTQAGNFATANVGAGIAVTTGDTIGGAQVGNYSLTQPTGLSANITAKGLTVSGSTAANKVYDQTTTATITGGTLVGVISGDTVTLTQAGNFATANVGTAIAVTTGDTIGGAQVGNYSLTQPTGLSANITAKELTVSGSTAANKVYDQTTTATITGGTLVGVISGDTVTLTQAGNFATANVGNGIAVTTGDTIGGAQVGNYSLTQPTGLSANITAKELTVSGSTAANKVYDKTTTATITGGTLVGVISGDTVTLTQAGNFATANVGNGIAVTTGDTIGGAQVGNYSLTQPTGLSANITAKELTVSGSTAANKVYDKTTTATVSGGTLVGVISGDTVTLTQAGNFVSANAGTGIAVTTGDTIGGTQAGNYSLTQPTGLSANITAKELTVSGITAANKVYDATNAASISTAGAVYTGLIAGDSVTVGATGSFDDKNVGNGKTVNLVSSHGGADLGNYSIIDQAMTTAKVTPAALTVGGITAANKVYDTTTGATVSTAGASYTGLFAGDSVTVNATGTFSDKNVADGKTVTLASSYTGADLGNYSITPQTSTTANITPAALTVTANADARFVTQADTAGYNGVSYDGLAGVETSSVLGGTLAITRPNAATDVAAGTYVGALVPSGYTSGNYSISYANGNYTVAPAYKLLVRTANTSVVYGSTPSLTITSAEYLDANNTTIHTLTGSGAGNSFTYTDGAGGSVSFVLTPSGATTSTAGKTVVGNFALTDAAPAIVGSNFNALVFVGNLAVTPKTVSATASGVTKIYDGNTSMTGVTLGLTGKEANDLLTVSGTGAFAQKNVGSALSYTIGGMSLGGADVGNYVLSGGATLAGSDGAITPKALTVSGITAANKIYNASTAASVTTAALTGASGLVAGDDVSVSASGTFADKNVGNGKTVTLVSNYGGVDRGNYSITGQTGATADITPAALSVSNITAASKVYDATTAATVSTAGASYAGLFAGDAVSVGATGTFSDKNVANSKTVTLASSYTGADVGNYTITGQTSVSADITPKGLTVTGITAADKVYDATSGATVNTAGASYAGLIAGDALSLSATGAFTDKNVANGKTVNLTSSYTGADVGNYSISDQAGTTANITPKSLTVTGSAAASKVYDKTTAATVTGGTLVGLVGGDAVTLTQAGSFATANAGTGIAVTTSDTIGGAEAGNYTLTQPTGLSADITPKGLTVSGSTAANKVYDQTTTATITGGTLVGVISGDTVTLTQAGNFATANVGNGIAVTTGDTIGGAQVGNYSLTQPTGLSANITAKELTVSGSTAANKVYDKTTTATVSGGTLVGVISGDTVTLTQAGNFATANVGTAIAVTTGDTIGGAQVGNYSLTQPTGLSANITAKELTVSGSTAANKVYDQTTTATITGGTLVGVISGDTVTLTQAGNFVSANAANVIVVNASDSLAGADFGNYTLTQPTGLAASITPKGLTVSGSSASDKVYDRSTTATITGGTLGGVISGDAVTLVQAGNFATMNVGNGIAVTASDTLGGAQAGNYAVIQPGGLSASITPKSATLQGSTGLNKVYDGNTDLPAAGYGALSGIIAGDTVQVQGTATYAAPNAGDQAVVQGSVALMGAAAGNYALVWANGAGTIARAALTVVANNDARFVIQSDAAGYNGVSFSGFVNGETSAVLGGSAAITRSNAATNGAGTYAGVLVPGGLSSTNYAISFVPGSYTIVPANQLLVRLPNAQTTYGSSAAYGPAQASYLASDNTTIVDLSGSTSTVGNVVTVNDGAGGTAGFTVAPVNARVSAGGALVVGSYQLGAGQVSATSANFNNNLVIVGAQQVDAKGITLSPSGATKVYDGNVSISGLQLGASGLVAGDNATPVGTGEFASRNAGTGLAYSLTGLDLTGADAGNYFVIGGSTQTGNNGVITPKLVTLTAPVVSKVYDGSAAYPVDAATLAALGQQLGVAGDSLGAISLVFADKNVATGKSLTASNATIADGNGGGNYQVSYATSQGSSITRLASVTWVGGATGNWFDPANWAGGAVPDLANVANVVIPANVTVTFGPTVVAPAQAGPVQIDSLGTAGTLAMPGGQLAVGSGGINLGAVTQSGGNLSSTGNVALGSLNQTGGSLATDSNFSTTTNFAQTGAGTVAVGGSTQITDTSGGATLGNLSSTGPLTVTSTDGPISQQPGTAVKAAGSTSLTASQGGAPADITLGGANQLGGPVSATGANVTLNNAGPLTLANVSASGNLTVQSNGALNLGTSQVGGNLTAGSGGGDINQSGTLQVGGSTTIDAGTGSVVLVDAGNLFGGPAQISGGTVAVFNPADNGSAPVSAAQIGGAVLAAAKGKAVNDETVRTDGRCSAVMQLQGTQGASAGASRVRSSRGDLRGAAFGFALPAAAADAVRAQPGSPAARLANGAALPGWLVFDAERLQLSAVAVPPGGLPIDVTIGAGTATVPLRIEAQGWDGSACSLR